MEFVSYIRKSKTKLFIDPLSRIATTVKVKFQNATQQIQSEKEMTHLRFTSQYLQQMNSTLMKNLLCKQSSYDDS